jgi:hypothetical protein
MLAHLNQNQNPSHGTGLLTFTCQWSNSSPSQATFNLHGNEDNIPTLKPCSKHTVIQQPEVVVQPPMSSTTGSKFMKMARGLARDIEAEQSRVWEAARHGDVLILSSCDLIENGCTLIFYTIRFKFGR